MLSERDATLLIAKAFPDSQIKLSCPMYRGLSIFRVIQNDPDEGDYDPFRSVNRSTGAIAEFSIITDISPVDIERLFIP